MRLKAAKINISDFLRPKIKSTAEIYSLYLNKFFGNIYPELAEKWKQVKLPLDQSGIPLPGFSYPCSKAGNTPHLLISFKRRLAPYNGAVRREQAMERETKKLVEKELESKVQEIEQRFQTQIEQELDKVKEQLRIIATSTAKIEELEKNFHRHVHENLEKIEKELAVIAASMSKLEGEISDKWNILVKLRSHSYEKLMSEYKKVEEKIFIDKKTAEELTDEEPAEL